MDSRDPHERTVSKEFWQSLHDLILRHPSWSFCLFHSITVVGIHVLDEG